MASSWQRLLTGVDDSTVSDDEPTTTETLRDRWRRAKKHLTEHTGHHGEGDTRRNSYVDPIPLIFTTNQWEELSEGIAQRARLLDAVLKDVYGPQNLLRKGLLPPEVVFGHAGYLQAMRNALPYDRTFLSLYAAQLCRDATGKWYVMADRAQGPSGAGYSVENRIAISGVLPEEFREMHVHRSAPFFAMLRDSMSRNAVMCDEESWMVLLSPGIRSSAYFEDAYLARYLGYTLAQAEDLTVRGGRVFLKTLAGLKRVSTIVRRLDDFDCDPLELNPAAVGVPGLCQAVRDQQVTVANQLGCGWAEQPALLKFLPLLCREMLGEELRLPSWPTRWCGDPADLDYVRRNLDSMVVRPAFTKENEKEPPSVLSQLSTVHRNRLLNDLARAPWKCVASELPTVATTPCWFGDQVVPWPYMIRVFAAVDDDGYRVLPSGIARVGPSADKLSDSLASGKMSKDVWVLSDAPVPLTSLMRPPQSSMEVQRTSFDLPSRVAFQMYWLGKWTSRAEGVARQARFCAQRLSAERDSDTLPVLAQVIHVLEGEHHSEDTDTTSPISHESLCDRIAAFCFDVGPTDALSNSLGGILRNATLLRDRLSRDSWSILSKMDVDQLVEEKLPGFADALPALNLLINHLTAFSGLVAESMTRGPGWLFLDIGRRIERILHQVQLIDSLLVPVQPRITPLLEAMLEIMDSSITYRYRYLMNFELKTVLDLLLLDQANPRSMVFHFSLLEEHLAALTGLDREGINEQRKKVQHCLALLHLFDTSDLTFATGYRKGGVQDEQLPYEIRPDLARMMNEMSTVLIGITDYLADRFFTHTKAVQLGSTTN